MKVEGTTKRIITSRRVLGHTAFPQTRYRLIGGFVLSKKMVGNQLRDWACPVSRYSYKHESEIERMVVYCIAKALSSYMSGKDNDLANVGPGGNATVRSKRLNILMVERKEV